MASKSESLSLQMLARARHVPRPRRRLPPSPPLPPPAAAASSCRRGGGCGAHTCSRCRPRSAAAAACAAPLCKTIRSETLNSEFAESAKTGCGQMLQGSSSGGELCLKAAPRGCAFLSKHDAQTATAKHNKTKRNRTPFVGLLSIAKRARLGNVFRNRFWWVQK